MTDTVLTGSVTQPKRTRIVGLQSKNGCLTCKARRIKCDEDKPLCVRCARSGRVCEGYPDKAKVIGSRIGSLLVPESLVEPSPTWALKSGCSQSERQHRLAQLGMDLLVLKSFNGFGEAAVVLNVLLPQLCHSLSSVNAAVTALGAVYNMQASCGSELQVDEAFAASHYRMALRSIRQDLLTQPHGPLPLILICFILSIVEIFLQQESNALIHIQGAFKLLQYRRNARCMSRPVKTSTPNADFHYPEDSVETLFRTVDLQTSSYAMSKTPVLQAIPMPPIIPSVTDLSSAHVVLVQLVHVCYTFASTAYKFKYQSQSTIHTLCIQQGRYVAHLSSWLKQFESKVLSTFPQDPTITSNARAYSHALILRMTALSTLIYLSCVLCPYETAYDVHSTSFQQIIADGEAILSVKKSDSTGFVRGLDSERFTTGPGLIQPLFLAAYKYRDPLHRRRAIRLLPLTGREGPWSGPREARVTSRIMELEERWQSDSSSTSTCGELSLAEGTTERKASTKTEVPAPSLTRSPSAGKTSSILKATATNMPETSQASSRAPSSMIQRRGFSEAQHTRMAQISEGSRIHGMGMSLDTTNGRPSHRVIVRFSRCNDIEGAVSHPCGHGPD